MPAARPRGKENKNLSVCQFFLKRGSFFPLAAFRILLRSRLQMQVLHQALHDVLRRSFQNPLEGVADGKCPGEGETQITSFVSFESLSSAHPLLELRELFLKSLEPFLRDPEDLRQLLRIGLLEQEQLESDFEHTSRLFLIAASVRIQLNGQNFLRYPQLVFLYALNKLTRVDQEVRTPRYNRPPAFLAKGSNNDIAGVFIGREIFRSSRVRLLKCSANFTPAATS